jgi:hypothetical protein
MTCHMTDMSEFLSIFFTLYKKNNVPIKFFINPIKLIFTFDLSTFKKMKNEANTVT